MPGLLQFPRKVAGYFFLDSSYEKYYTPQSWDSEYYRGHSLDSPKESDRYVAVCDLVRQYADNGSILDAGCGEGLLEVKCRGLTSKIVGIDYSHVAIAKARMRNLQNCEFICTDTRVFCSDRVFSVIVFNESLYYIDRYLDCLRAMTFLLSNNGVFIVSMYDTRITRRIWHNLSHEFLVVSEMHIRNDITWTVRALRPSWNLPARQSS